MISLKIKTLDSRDHDFTVADDITVRQFKEHIVTKTGIAAEVQRLIYCGRVLVDDKPLSEYNVNGKVVHLVERQPPRTRPEPRSESANGRRNMLNNLLDGHNPPLMRTIDGMVMGAVAIPYNSGNGTGAPINPSSTLCMNRITVARHMLQCAENIINYLENPALGLNNADLDILAQHTLESTVFEVGISAVSEGDVPTQDMQNFVQAFQGAVSAAFRQNGLTNIAVSPPTTTVEPTTRNSGSAHTLVTRPRPVVSVSTTTSDGTSAEPNAADPTLPAPGSARTRSQSANSTRTPSSTTGAESTSGTSSASSQNNSASTSPSRSQTTSPTVLAEVVRQMRTIQGRMEPYIQQYHDILMNEPRFADNNARFVGQRVYDRVSEALHYMSHAQHAISDLMLNLSNAPPRHLSCRPILVEQSAYQSLIPMPRRVGIINGVMSMNGAGNNNETAAPNNNPTPSANPTPTMNPVPNATVAGSPQMVQINLNNLVNQVSNLAAAANQQQPMEDTSSSSTESEPVGGSAPQPTAASAPTSEPSTSNSSAADAVNNQQASIGRLIQGIVNSVSLYSDFHLDMDIGVFGDAGGPIPPNEPAANEEQNPNPTTPAAPPAATDGSSTTTQSAFTQSETPPTATPASGTPRVSTATFPTTSTQTRSTARPQVHVTSLPAGMRQFQASPAMQFDRFLPCTSHHVRENQEAHRQQLVHVHRRTPMRRAYASGANMHNSRSHSHNASRVNRSTIPPAHLNSTFNLFNGTFRMRDMNALVPSVATINRNREAFRSYLIETFSGMAEGIAEWNECYELLADLVRTSVLRNAPAIDPNYDPILSVNNLLRQSLRPIIDLVLNDSSGLFGERILRLLAEFTHRLISTLIICVGVPNTLIFLMEFVTGAMTIYNPRADGNIRAFIALAEQTIRQHIRSRQTAISDVLEFLVIPLQAPPQAETPMDTDDSAAVPLDSDQISPVPTQSTPRIKSSSSTQTSPQRQIESDPPPQAQDPEPLPSVLYGSESWHNGMPTSWVPTITRDMGRQRRTSAPTPYSDAYLSGMSSKRRKVITSSRPSTSNPTSMFSDGLRNLFQNRTVASGSRFTPAALDESLASHQSIFDTNGPLERAFRDMFGNRIRTDLDYEPTRYPHLHSWTSKKK